jgi:hypothetical protein
MYDWSECSSNSMCVWNDVDGTCSAKSCEEIDISDVCFKIKTKSSCNKDTFVFISEMEDKRICRWQAISKLIEFNKIIYVKNIVMS